MICNTYKQTKRNLDSYDRNGEVIVIGLRVKRSDNLMARVVHKRLRVNLCYLNLNLAVSES